MVDSPYGVPYPGGWALWRGQWFEARTYSDEDRLVLLSHEGSQAPGSGWEQAAANNSSPTFTRIVPFSELAEFEEYKVGAQWRGFTFSALRFGADGVADGWLTAPPGGALSGSQAAKELEQAGYWHGTSDQSTVEARIPLTELDGFRVVRHRNLLEVLRKAGW